MTPPTSPTCPACGGPLTLFHTQENVPVHSCQLVDSRDAALSYPTGDLRLGVCEACAFVTNTAYDPARNDYATAYEETQGFSPRFRRFARELASRWVDRYDLRDRDIVEIGCGKGEFLALLCELGDNRGVGIDPSYMPGRPHADTSRARFVTDLYGEQHARLPADAIVCRHTLEHIHPVAEFLRLIRRAIGDRTNVVVLFEVPDVLRVLREGAFWDVYYEHCSYFSAGSLARLFRATGFEPLDLSLEYDGQYLVIEAVPAPGGAAGPRFAAEDDRHEVLDAVQHFRTAYAAAIKGWRGELSARRAAGERAVIWGAGSKGVSFLVAMGAESGVEQAVDINPLKQGMFLAGTGVQVVAPASLKADPPDLVVVMNPIYVEEITGELHGLDIDADVRAL